MIEHVNFRMIIFYTRGNATIILTRTVHNFIQENGYGTQKYILYFAFKVRDVISIDLEDAALMPITEEFQ
jgi:hypothetical protein